MNAPVQLDANSSVLELMKPITDLLARNPQATELTMYNPGEFYLELEGQWTRTDIPAMTLQACIALANAVAIRSQQDISAQAPLLSATLPHGQRMQIILPPAVETGKVAFCIRIPSTFIRTLDEYEEEGAFDKFIWPESLRLKARWADVQVQDQLLCEQLRKRDLKGFLIACVLAKKNIAVVGDTGSGKTTLMKSLCPHIPANEHLITIEDTRELFLPGHANRKHLLYSKGSQGVAQVTPAELIAACMRLKPDRVLLAELRGSEAFDFLKLLTTGHSGSITSFHAESCALGEDRYVFMAKEHPDAAIFSDKALKRLIRLTMDVLLHVAAKKHYGPHGEVIKVERYVTAVSFDPVIKLDLAGGEGEGHSG